MAVVSGTLMIRNANESDEADIRDCAEEAYCQYIAAIGGKPAPMVADFGRQISAGLIYVAVNKQNEVMGFINFFPRNGHMLLENVAIKRSFAGQGIGKHLILYCEKEAKRLGLESVQLYTNEKMIANLSIYPHLGYLETERRTEDMFNRVYFEKKLS